MVNIDWNNLPFGYMKTNGYIFSHFKNGAWVNLEVSQEEYFSIHISAICLHYGQSAFEGLKAFRGKNNKIFLFRPRANAKRLAESARAILMPEVNENMFFEAVKKVVLLNEEFVPPYGSGASLYIRPLLFGSSGELGLKASSEYIFLVFCSPVGPYFKDGFKPVDFYIDRDHDRAAPLGTGHVKVAGNYAASLKSMYEAKHHGYASVIYLDAKEKKYIDECGPANFFAIQNNTYITPASDSILPSITNDSLKQIAKFLGLKVEERKISVEELENFEEIGACGTAAVVIPIKAVTDGGTGKIYKYCRNGQAGTVSTKLYDILRAIQVGDEKDRWGWVEEI